MNTTAKRWISYAVVFCLMPWMTGCDSLTGRLWGRDLGENDYQAAQEPDLKLSQTPDRKDVLVQYDEMRDKDAKIRHRAYFLYADDEIIKSGKKPRFLTAAAASKVQGAPLTIGYATNLSPAGGMTLRAVLAEDKHHFTLVSNGREIGSYQLPDYMQHSTWVQVLLTPAAVTGDVLIVAGIAAVVVGVLYLRSQSGN